jgi:hypothetical protein
LNQFGEKLIIQFPNVTTVSRTADVIPFDDAETNNATRFRQSLYNLFPVEAPATNGVAIQGIVSSNDRTAA